MAIKETVEREVKLRAGDAFRLPELGGEAIEPREFVSTYHDTADHRLARRGITLRHRVENGKGLWQLKLPHGNARLELEEPGAPTAPPEALSGLLAGHLRGVPLLPIARLRTHREGVRADGAEVVHDTVAVLDHQRVTRSFEELEVELLDGDEKTLRRLEKALRRAGAADGETRPKVFQALDLEFEAEPPESGDGTSASAVLRARLREQAEELLAHDAGTRLGTDAEELHQFRVATRRLRAFLRAGGDLLDQETTEPLRAELRWLGSTLGPVRDLDVLIERLAAEVSTLGVDEAEGRKLVRTLDRSRRSARRRLLTALNSARYFALLDALEHPFATIADEPSLAEIHAAEHRKLKQAVNAAHIRLPGRGAPRRPDQSQACALCGGARGRQALRVGGEAIAGCARRAPGRRRRDREASEPCRADARCGRCGRAADRTRAGARAPYPRCVESVVEAAGEDGVVRACGGLILRDGLVVVVHRPKYDDWSFPKGKAHPGESDEECALREIDEETGLQVQLDEELATTTYVDAKGRPKRVRWWRMTPLEGEFTPTEEIDELRWLTPVEARRLLTYSRDVELLDSIPG